MHSEPEAMRLGEPVCGCPGREPGQGFVADDDVVPEGPDRLKHHSKLIGGVTNGPDARPSPKRTEGHRKSCLSPDADVARLTISLLEIPLHNSSHLSL